MLFTMDEMNGGISIVGVVFLYHRFSYRRGVRERMFFPFLPFSFDPTCHFPTCFGWNRTIFRAVCPSRQTVGRGLDGDRGTNRSDQGL